MGRGQKNSVADILYGEGLEPVPREPIEISRSGAAIPFTEDEVAQITQRMTDAYGEFEEVKLRCTKLGAAHLSARAALLLTEHPEIESLSVSASMEYDDSSSYFASMSGAVDYGDNEIPKLDGAAEDPEDIWLQMTFECGAEAAAYAFSGSEYKDGEDFYYTLDRARLISRARELAREIG